MLNRFRWACLILFGACLFGWMAQEASADKAKKGNTSEKKKKSTGDKAKGPDYSGVIGDLQQAHHLLAVADPIYVGHRGNAMQELTYAIHVLKERQQHPDLQKGGKVSAGKSKSKAKSKGSGKQAKTGKQGQPNFLSLKESNGNLQKAEKIIKAARHKVGKTKDVFVQDALGHMQAAVTEIGVALAERPLNPPKK